MLLYDIGLPSEDCCPIIELWVLKHILYYAEFNHIKRTKHKCQLSHIFLHRLLVLGFKIWTQHISQNGPDFYQIGKEPFSTYYFAIERLKFYKKM